MTSLLRRMEANDPMGGWKSELGILHKIETSDSLSSPRKDSSNALPAWDHSQKGAACLWKGESRQTNVTGIWTFLLLTSSRFGEAMYLGRENSELLVNWGLWKFFLRVP